MMSDPSDAEQFLELIKASLQSLDYLRQEVKAIAAQADRSDGDNARLDEAIDSALRNIERAREALEAVEYR